MDALKAAYQEIARIDAEVRDKLLKRARKQGMVNQGEVIELVKNWKRAAARVDKRRRRERHKGH